MCKTIYPKTALVLLPVSWVNLPPIGIASLKDYLFSGGVTVDCLDYNNVFFGLADDQLQRQWKISCNMEFEKNIFDIIRLRYEREYMDMIDRLSGYDIVGFSVHESNIDMVHKVASVLKVSKNDIRLVTGGPEVTIRYIYGGEAALSSLYEVSDLVVAGEGEVPFYEYVTGRRKGGIACFQEIQDESRIPVPDYSDFDLLKYPRKNSISLLSSRGCIRSCRFCSERSLYTGYRRLSIGKISALMRSYKSRGIKYFVFHDSLVNGDLRYMEELLDAMINDVKDIMWEAQMSIRGDMEDALLHKIKKSGCCNLFIGLESASDKILASMRKGYDSCTARKFFERLSSHDIQFGVSMMIGYPGEDDSDFRDSLDFIVNNKDIIRKVEQLNPFIRYRGADHIGGERERDKRESLRRMDIFKTEIKARGVKYTNAFISNLLGPDEGAYLNDPGK